MLHWYPATVYDSSSCIYTVKYKIKLLDESIVEESLEEGSTFFVNEGNCTIIFIQMIKCYRALLNNVHNVLVKPENNMYWMEKCSVVPCVRLNQFYVFSGHTCPALPKVLKTMKEGERAVVMVQSQCTCHCYIYI
jgi:hypothetical protein